MCVFRLFLLPALALPLSASILHAQLVGGQWETLHHFNGLAQFQYLGVSVSDAGDVDGDGFDDVIVGAYGASPGGLSAAGSAYVYSGITGVLIWQFDGQAADDNLGYSVSSAGDIDGDGFDDLIVGVSNADPGGLSSAGSALVFSGATGTLIWQFDGQAAGDVLGLSVSGVGDVDGDGFDDIIIGAPQTDSGGLSNAGSAYVYSGATGILIWQFDGQATGGFLGWSVSGAGEVDGDGVDDVVVGALFAPFGVLGAGTASVYSGATGALVWQFDGQLASDNFGWSVSGAGDVDGDGFGDVIVGAWGADPGGRVNAGSAYVYSGNTGVLLWQFDGQEPGDEQGNSVSGAGDVDGDGFDDVIVGANAATPGVNSNAGSAYLFSGSTGALIRRFDGLGSSDLFGFSVSGAGDVNGDGLADVIVGAFWADNGAIFNAGAAYIYSLDPFLHMSSSELSVSGGSTLQLGMDFPASEAGARYAVLASITGTGPIVMGGLEIPLTQDNVFNAIAGGNAPALLQGAFGTLNANGQALATLSAGPALAPVIGQTIYFAAATYDVGPLTGRMSSVVRYLQILP